MHTFDVKQQIETSVLISVVELAQDVPDKDEIIEQPLPVVYLLPTETKSSPNNDDVGLTQEQIVYYKLLIACGPYDENNNNDPLTDIIKDIENALLAFVINEDFGELFHVSGQLHDVSPHSTMWLETYACKRILMR